MNRFDKDPSRYNTGLENIDIKKTLVFLLLFLLLVIAPLILGISEFNKKKDLSDIKTVEGIISEVDIKTGSFQNNKLYIVLENDPNIKDDDKDKNENSEQESVEKREYNLFANSKWVINLSDIKAKVLTGDTVIINYLEKDLEIISFKSNGNDIVTENDYLKAFKMLHNFNGYLLEIFASITLSVCICLLIKKNKENNDTEKKKFVKKMVGFISLLISVGLLIVGINLLNDNSLNFENNVLITISFILANLILLITGFSLVIEPNYNNKIKSKLSCEKSHKYQFVSQLIIGIIVLVLYFLIIVFGKMKINFGSIVISVIIGIVIVSYIVNTILKLVKMNNIYRKINDSKYVFSNVYDKLLYDYINDKLNSNLKNCLKYNFDYGFNLKENEIKILILLPKELYSLDDDVLLMYKINNNDISLQIKDNELSRKLQNKYRELCDKEKEKMNITLEEKQMSEVEKNITKPEELIYQNNIGIHFDSNNPIIIYSEIIKHLDDLIEQISDYLNK